MRKNLIPASAAVALLFIASARPAHAVSKEIIQLQTQVQQLQDMLQHLQQSNDERMGVLQHLVEQTADSVNRMAQTVNTLQQQIAAQNDPGGKIDQVSSQVQGLHDSVDELRSRITKMDKELQDIQSQLQNVKDIFFDYDSYDIRSDAQSTISQDANFLNQHPALKVVIGGYCDERGSTEYNLALGENRANAAKQGLVTAGVSPDRLRTVSYGKEKQFCTEHDESCWQLNRRAQFSLDK